MKYWVYFLLAAMTLGTIALHRLGYRGKPAPTPWASGCKGSWS